TFGATIGAVCSTLTEATCTVGFDGMRSSTVLTTGTIGLAGGNTAACAGTGVGLVVTTGGVAIGVGADGLVRLSSFATELRHGSGGVVSTTFTGTGADIAGGGTGFSAGGGTWATAGADGVATGGSNTGGLGAWVSAGGS